MRGGSREDKGPRQDESAPKPEPRRRHDGGVNRSRGAVTGGGTGIGRETCLRLNRWGSGAEAQHVAALVQRHGRRALAVEVDVAHDADVRRMMARVGDTLGRLDGVVNNAGITTHIGLGDLEAVTDEVWDRIMNVNLRGMFYVARAAAPLVRRAGGGAIVNVGSVSGLSGSGSSLPYAVSKAAVHGLTRSLARALAPDIRVNGVAPGAVATRWWDGRSEDMARIEPTTLFGHTVSTADVAAAIVGLLQQDSTTGQVLTVDGGAHM